MRHSKNNSSICETTTLLSMSNISAESTEWPSFPARQHDHLAQKVQELELILHTTLAEGSLLAKRQQQLANALASRKATLDRMYRLPPPTEPDCSEDELAETQRAGKGWGQSKGEDGLGRTVKQHQKFYSAIQSPAVSYSPERNYDQFTLQSYQKSRYGPQSTASSKSGMIRKQRDQLRVRETSYLSPRQRDFESIEEIWNGGSTRRGQQKPPGHKSIKSFL